MSQFERKWTDYLVYLRPKFSVMISKYDQEWDNFINEAADRGLITYTGSVCNELAIGNIPIWTANYPYAYGKPWIIGFRNSCTIDEELFTKRHQSHETRLCSRPSRLTIYRLERLRLKLMRLADYEECG